MSSQQTIEARGVSKRFGRGAAEVVAVDDVDLDVAAGELVLIMGPSGSGKTTLLSMLGGLLRPTTGHILFGDIDIATLPEKRLPSVRAEKLGFVFQSFNLLDALTVEENILIPARLTRGGVSAARPRAAALIDRLDLGHRRRAHPSSLSGGERQRVAIARALINRPPIILADEPTGNLDSQKGQDVIMILHDIARDEGCSVLVVTHDPRIEDVADRVLWLEDGRIRDRRQEQHQWVRDPVCGMRVDDWTATIRAEHAGTSHVFCSTGCRDRFQANPDGYVASHGGAT